VRIAGPLPASSRCRQTRVMLDLHPSAGAGFAELEDLDTLLSKQGLSPKTRSHVFAAVRVCMRWLKKRRVISEVPDLPTIRVPEHDPALLDPEQQRAVLDVIPTERRGIFLALAHHGLRPSEAARLNVADYDYASGVIRLRGASAKTRTGRAIPCSAELRDWITTQVDPAGRLVGAALFQNSRGRTAGKRWNLDTLEDQWRAAVTAAGVPTVALYEGTKHSSATSARRAGVALEVIQ